MLAVSNKNEEKDPQWEVDDEAVEGLARMDGPGLSGRRLPLLYRKQFLDKDGQICRQVRVQLLCKALRCG